MQVFYCILFKTFKGDKMETSFVEIKFDKVELSVADFHFDVRDIDIIVEYDFTQEIEGMLAGAKSSLGVPEEPDEIIYKTSISRVIMYMNDTEIDILSMKGSNKPFFVEIFATINNVYQEEVEFC